MGGLRKKLYVTERAIRFTVASKHKLRSIIKDKGLSSWKISSGTGIPVSTIDRWLSDDNHEFPPLPSACVLADFLGISVREMLAEQAIRTVDEERYSAVAPFYDMPIEHVRWLFDVYRGAVRVIKR